MSDFDLTKPEAVDDGKGKAVAPPQGGETNPAPSEPDGKGEGWTAILPKEYREKYAEQLKGFAKPKDLFDAYIANSDKLKGAIFRPGENATDEEKKAYLKALGVPDKYTLPTLTEEQKGYLGDVESFEKFFTEAAAKTDMTQAQAEAFYNLYVGANVQRAKEAQAKEAQILQERADTLNKEWGDAAKGNFELARRAFTKYATKEFAEYCEKQGLGTNPDFIRVFYEIAKRVSGDPGTERTPGNIQEERKGLHYDSLNERFKPRD